MIRQVKIRNFRALKEVDVGVRPLTVLVGPNDSGKSSFLEALLQRLNHTKSPREDWWRRSEQRPEVETFREPNVTFEGSAEVFKLPSQGIPMESAGMSEGAYGGAAPPLDETGKNLAAFLDYLLRKDRQRFDLIQADMRRLVPGFEEIRISTPSPETRSIQLSVERGFEISGQRLSTGARMLFFFVALAHHPAPKDVVLIEEPENGVHPKRLQEIVALLRTLTQGTLGGKAVQVIMTTHSPYLLDQIKPPDDGVIVFRREPDGRRTATEVDAQRLRSFLDEFMLGEVWFNQGEEGLLTKER